MTRASIIDTIRRELLADLHARIADAGLDGDLAESVRSDLQELLDALLLAYQAAGLTQPGGAVIGSFVFVDCWPRIVQHVGPMAVRVRGGSARAAERMGMVQANRKGEKVAHV